MHIAGLLLFCTGLAAAVQGCTVLELTGAGFAANAVHVLHAYTLFSQSNGTLYLNSTEFQYKCAKEGGWHDFFDFTATNGSMANYVPEADQAETCAIYTFHDVDLMLHNMNYDWFSIDTAAAKKVLPVSPSTFPAALEPFQYTCFAEILMRLSMHNDGRMFRSGGSRNGFRMSWTLC